MTHGIEPRAVVWTTHGLDLNRNVVIIAGILLFGSGAVHYTFVADPTAATIGGAITLWGLTALIAWAWWSSEGLSSSQRPPQRAEVVVTDRAVRENGSNPRQILREEVTSVQFHPRPENALLGPLSLLISATLTVSAGQTRIRFTRGDFEWAVDLVRAWVRARPELAEDEVTRQIMTAPDHSPLIIRDPPGPLHRVLWIAGAIAIGWSGLVQLSGFFSR